MRSLLTTAVAARKHASAGAGNSRHRFCSASWLDNNTRAERGNPSSAVT